MKYLKLLLVVLAAAFVSHGAMAVSQAAVDAAAQRAAQKQALVQQQQAAAQLLGQRNARLTALHLPTTAEYRAALIASGDHGGGATAGVIILQVLETQGVPGIHHTYMWQVVLADALFAIDENPTDVTQTNIRIANLLVAQNIPVDKVNMDASIALHALTPPLYPITQNIAVYSLLIEVGLGAGEITAAKVKAVVDQAGNIDNEKAAALLVKINKFDSAGQNIQNSVRTYMDAAEAFAGNDAAWKKATTADLEAWAREGDAGNRANMVTAVATR